jgi:hypothetical protein
MKNINTVIIGKYSKCVICIIHMYKGQKKCVFGCPLTHYWNGLKLARDTPWGLHGGSSRTKYFETLNSMSWFF